MIENLNNTAANASMCLNPYQFYGMFYSSKLDKSEVNGKDAGCDNQPRDYPGKGGTKECLESWKW